MEQIDNNNIKEFEINKIVVDTHNKIAKWYNDDKESANSISLKFLSLEIVQDIAGCVFKHLGLEYSEGLKLDDEIRKKLNEHNIQLQSEKNVNNLSIVKELSDEELLREIEKRKLKS